MNNPFTVECPVIPIVVAYLVLEFDNILETEETCIITVMRILVSEYDITVGDAFKYLATAAKIL